MKTLVYIMLLAALLICCPACTSQSTPASASIRTGAERVETYLPILKGRKIGVVANHTSLVGSRHLVDSLRNMDGFEFEILRVFSPEHGFRGRVERGELFDDGVDEQTGLPVVSLYGSHRKPGQEDLEGLDLMVFDLQDVGARFYTYISTLFYVMQACAEYGLELLLLDRPNPNGFYVDGPVLEPDFSSFVGMHQVPVVYGMTIGEYGKMINGEGWLGEGLRCRLTVIPCENYDRSSSYELPVPPSPNLPSMNSIYLYPSLCFFEGTVISEGRGTDFPFEAYGHPDLPDRGFSFIPESIPVAARNPKHEGMVCYGKDLRYMRDSSERQPSLNLSWLIEAYGDFPDKDKFFIPFFETLAGTGELRNQIISGMSEEEIRASWQPDLDEFKAIRQKYLIYPE